MIFKAFICFDEEGFIKSICRNKNCDNPICNEYVIKLTEIKRDILSEELTNVKDALCEVNQNFEKLNRELRRRI